ncbi:hypothetical protein [Micromonospora sp. KC606]|uniref:hypothetical protein n=1 Tax=Micromonospora sp. KC606 TaxID=2530379 RepID=UPI001FB6B413|nr:hypothetical protein [Micromonospora sp. KC606]
MARVAPEHVVGVHIDGGFGFPSSFHVETPDQAIAPDHILTNVSLSWFTGTSGSSSWPMYQRLMLADDGGFVWPKGQKRVPSGVYGSGSALMRRLAGRDNTIIHWPEGNPGGHFVAMEVPESHVADIRAFFGKLRCLSA